ncbi:MAG: hypothetical protein GQ534_00785 [Candidatus Delongbacteria bacterium]|nr:hypothetical protein [Candidatus Delongbacteria bacterium]
MFFSREKNINAFWFMRKEWTLTQGNVGDIITPYLIENISGIFPKLKTKGGNRHLVVGSLISLLQNKDQVWGAGLIKDMIVPKRKNVKFYAVRGPLTRDKLIESGYEADDIPQVYGDPGILVSDYFKFERNIQHKIGIIPHYVDAELCKIYFKDTDVHFIDINNSVEKFFAEINKCEYILSSSLHGIIFSESYGIKAIPIKLGDKLIGDSFKFDDYYQSTGRNSKRVVIDSILNNNDIEKLTRNYDFIKPILDKELLLRSCPFNKGEI